MCWSIKQPFGLPLHLPSATFLGLLYTSTLYCSLIWPLHPICFPPSILQTNPLSSKHPTLLFLYFSCIPVYSSVIPLYFHFVSPPLLFDSYFLAVASVIVSVFLVSVYLFNSFRVGGWGAIVPERTECRSARSTLSQKMTKQYDTRTRGISPVSSPLWKKNGQRRNASHLNKTP